MLSQLIVWLRQRIMDKLGFLCLFFLNKESNNPTTNWRAWNSKEFPPKHEEILCRFLKQTKIQRRKGKERKKELNRRNTLIKLDLKEEFKNKPSKIKRNKKKHRSHYISFPNKSILLTKRDNPIEETVTQPGFLAKDQQT